MIFTVIKSYLKSTTYLFTKSLVKYIIYTVIFSMLVGGLLMYLIYNFSDDFYHLIEKTFGFDVQNGILDTSLSVLTGIIFTLLCFLVFKYIVLILASPLLGPLSEKIESIETGQKVEVPFDFPTLSKSITRSTAIAGRLIIRELMFTLPLMVLSFIPVIGVFFVGLIFLLQSYYAGIGAIDVYQDRNRNIKETIAFARKNKLTMIVLGAGFVGMLLIPIAGVLLAPILSTMAGTMVGLKLDKKV